jgi:ABC-type sugar transport system ATPase subunit
MTLADKIVALRAGRVEQVGPPLALYHRPENLFVAGFIGSPQMNFVKTKVVAKGPEGVRVALPGGASVTARVAADGVAEGEPVTLGLRPEHVAVEGGERLPGRVDVVEQLGESHFVHLDLSDGQRLIARAQGDAPVRAGQGVEIGVNGGDCHLFRDDGRACPRLS